MVAIVGGNSLGLSLGWMGQLGTRGSFGNAGIGRGGDAAFVNASTGGLVLRSQDDLLVGRGIDVASVRTYNSQGKLNDDNGDNWGSGFYLQQLRLIGTRNAVGSSLVRTDRDGAEATFTYDTGRSLYVSADGGGAYDSATWDATKSQYVWSDGDSGAQERYDVNGRLLSSKDASGNTASYAYNAAGRIASVSDAGGEQTLYDYSGNNLTQIRTVYQGGTLTSTRVRYGYDTSNRLSSVTVDLSPGDNAVDDGNVYATTYTYDGTSRRVASLVESDGTSLSFAYVQVGSDWRLASASDALGQTTQFAYDTGLRRTAVTDSLGLVTLFDYDAAGQLLKVTSPPSGGRAETMSFAYSSSGDLLRAVDGEGRAIDMAYDGNGNQVFWRDAAGNTVTRTFDARNQLLTETAFAVADPDGAGPQQPSQPLTTRYVYDAAGKNLLRFVVTAEGRVAENVYDSYGQRTASLQYAAAAYDLAGLSASTAPSEAQLATWAAAQDRSRLVRTDFAYDVRGQLTKSTAYGSVDASGVGVADSSRSITTYAFDQAGLLLKAVSALSGTTLYTYDGLGRRLSQTDALGQTTLTSYDDANAKTQVAWANGLVTSSLYDRAGRLVAVSQADSGGAPLASSRVAGYALGCRSPLTVRGPQAIEARRWRRSAAGSIASPLPAFNAATPSFD